ncbi:hypothetical protein ACH5RR_038981, partial [Cinchona calisaya]
RRRALVQVKVVAVCQRGLNVETGLLQLNAKVPRQKTKKFGMMSKFGKCNVCASPCASCVRLGPELLPSGSTSRYSSDVTCEHKVACPWISQTSTALSMESEEGILESNGDENSCVRGAQPRLSPKHYKKDKNNEAVNSSSSAKQRAPQAFERQPASCCLADYHSEVDNESHCSDSSKNSRNDVSEGILPFFVKSEPNALSSVKDLDAGPTSVKGHLHACFMGRTASSSSIIMERAAGEDPKQDVADSVKTSKVKFAEDIATKSLNCSNHEKHIISIEQSNVDKPWQFSEFVRSDDKSALLDVKVCDICGDAGREDLLAVCSKCNDGAEHIYCMHRRLDKVPDSNWMCEECVLSETKDRMTKTKFETFVACPNYISSNQPYQCGEISKVSDVKVLPEVNTKGLGFEKSRGDELSSLPSVERSSGNVTSASVTRRTALGTKSEPSPISRDRKACQAQGLGIKPGHELCAPNDFSSRTRSIQEKAPLPIISGNLTKSKSFNDSVKRPKVLRLDQLPQDKFSSETRDKKKVSTVRRLGKSLSFNNASSGHSNVFGQKSKRIPSKFPEDSDMKRLRYMKEDSSIEMTSTLDFKRPQAGSPKDGLRVSASCDKKFASPGEMILPDVYGNKHHDAKAVQSQRNSETESGVKKLCSTVANVVQDVPFPTRSDASQVVKHKSGTTSHFSLNSCIPVSRSDTMAEDKLTIQKTSCNEDEKFPQISNFTRTTDIMSNGSRSECCGKSESLCHASQSRLAESSSVSVLDVEMVKDVSGNGQMDLGSPFCNQLNAYRKLAVPMFDYIWKGAFEIQNTERLPRVLYRMQAHLSTRASSRIPETVKKFSDKLLLEEVSRVNAWPTQFREYSPQDNSIGLYFFAEDISSYGIYKSFLQCLVNYDLALRGNLNGIELLIFSSHLLPESSKYWNGLLFLWGVFEERKLSGS